MPRWRDGDHGACAELGQGQGLKQTFQAGQVEPVIGDHEKGLSSGVSTVQEPAIFYKYRSACFR
jgi:hypothetical protein